MFLLSLRCYAPDAAAPYSRHACAPSAAPCLPPLFTFAAMMVTATPCFFHDAATLHLLFLHFRRHMLPLRHADDAAGRLPPLLIRH